MWLVVRSYWERRRGKLGGSGFWLLPVCPETSAQHSCLMTHFLECVSLVSDTWPCSIMIHDICFFGIFRWLLENTTSPKISLVCLLDHAVPESVGQFFIPVPQGPAWLRAEVKLHGATLPTPRSAHWVQDQVPQRRLSTLTAALLTRLES